MPEQIFKLLDLIKTAVDLANSVREDIIHRDRQISDNTVVLMSRFRTKHDELNTLLDIANEIN